MNYIVTIAMPIYNVGGDVERAILSALNQTFASIELLIIDDKGTDNTMDIVRHIIANHPRGKDVRIIDHGSNQGTGATKNSAIEAAQGQYLYFMDSDDVITTDCIEALYLAMTYHPVDFVAASFARVSADGESELFVTQLKDLTLETPYALAKYRKGTVDRFYIMTWNKLFDINFLRDNLISCIPHHLNEDVWFSFQLNYCTNSFTMLSKVTYRWYIRANSTTHQVANGLKESNVKAHIEALTYKKEAIANDPRAAKCPYIVDDVVEFAMRLSEGILRSTMPIALKKQLIEQVTDMHEISNRVPDRAVNRFAFALLNQRAMWPRMTYLYAIRYGRGIGYKITHPCSIFRKLF